VSHPIQTVCVYCGHAEEVPTFCLEIAKELGKLLAQNNLNLVYGGGKMGMMGALADEVLNNGGNVIGFIPHYLDIYEGAHPKVQELHRVNTMHERKLLMAERADAFIALPGGFGTLDEFFEILTWKQIGLHEKPIIILNAQNYWEKLIALLEHAIDHQFAKQEHRLLYKVVSTASEIIPILKK
jgi:hypothetical protein